MQKKKNGKSSKPVNKGKNKKAQKESEENQDNWEDLNDETPALD